MRRAKIKATVCVGRKKPDISRKINENKQENCDTSLPNSSLENTKSEILQETPSKSVKTPVDITSQAKLDFQDNFVPTEPNASYIGHIESSDSLHSDALTSQPNPINLIDSIILVSPSHSTKTQSPLTNDAIPSIDSSAKPSKENSTPLTNRGILSRSKIKAVPKLRSRKNSSYANPSDNTGTKADDVVAITEQTTNITGAPESISKNSDYSLSENVGSQINLNPPTSPSKMCRSKIKAIPILGNRKNFSSASDSEDGNKRSSFTRTRTESQCSNISGIAETTDDQPLTSKKTEHSSDIKRKFRKSEGSKKLADARREFAKKYVDGKPDYKKLTMMDLIFYNPTTNPMRYEKKKSTDTTETSIAEEKEEDVDNPAKAGECASSKDDDTQADMSEDEDEIIAPRIKIGPTGEIVLDEKSLVIENKKTKKAIEEIEKSAAIDGDLDRPYGFYKRLKKPKDWSQSETVKFYRALSTVGTDFSLMNELFPKRTRRELKMKFKKEEKINQALIDKAIMEPCNFNFEDLKTEFEMMEIEELEIEKQQLNEHELNKTKQNKKTGKFLKIIEMCNQPDNSQENMNDAIGSNSPRERSITKRGRKVKTPKLPKTPKKLDIFSVLTSESDCSDQDSGSSEGSFVLKSTQTTRYGRKTKRREFYEPDIDPDEEFTFQKKIRKPIPEPEPPQKPGSLMVVSSETADGKPMVQIFMVTDDKTKVSNQNESDSKNLLPIAMIRTGHTDDEAEEDIVENNYTIPAEESPTHQNNVRELHENLTKDKEEIVENTHKTKLQCACGDPESV